MTSVLPDIDGLTPISNVPSTPLMMPCSSYITELLLNPGFALLKKPGFTIILPWSKTCWWNHSEKLWNGPGSSARRTNSRDE